MQQYDNLKLHLKTTFLLKINISGDEVVLLIDSDPTLDILVKVFGIVLYVNCNSDCPLWVKILLLQPLLAELEAHNVLGASFISNH